MAEWLVLHQCLTAVLFIFFSSWIWRDVGSRDDHNMSAPGSWFSPEGLGHRVLSGKLQESHAVELGGVRAAHVVVNNGECSGTLSLLQVILNSTRPIKAKDDEVT